MKFQLEYNDQKSGARAGSLFTAHGVIQTPIFMPVGTVGSVKTLHQQELKDRVKAQIILGNTYHLFLRPGTAILQEAGGLHKFMNWDRPILTDSGGYQIFSLSGRRKITEEGAQFQNHINGSKHLFTPENVMDIQRQIGGDIIMAFDECPPYPSDIKYATRSMHLTHRWLQRCVNHFNEGEGLYGYEQALFPIVQGSTYVDLRKQSSEFIAEQNCFGNAIGGLSVGEPAELMYEMSALVCGILPKDKPRYLMGVGTPVNILENIAIGIDMFDCVMPTRNARNGMLFTKEGIINIRNKKWERDFTAIDEELMPEYSKAYLRHLFISEEILAKQIASIHNLSFYLWLVTEARNKIIDGTFSEWKSLMIPKLGNRL